MPSGKGRPRKPTALKVLHGDFEKNPQRKPKGEPQSSTGTPSCPRHLDRLAKNEWKRICKELDQLKVLTPAERASIEQYCVAYSEWRQALSAVQKEGRYYSTEKGLIEHPAAKALRSLAGICHRYLCEFGLTPSSRSRLHVTEQTEQDSIEAKFLG